MNKHNSELFAELIKYKGNGTKNQKDRDKSYIGSTKSSFFIKSSIKRQIVKNWINKHKQLRFDEYLNLLNSLYQGKSHDEISIAGKLLEFLPKLRKQLNPKIIDLWLTNVEGWAEVDSLCQSNFTCDEILNKWKEWEKLLIALSKSDNVHKRRASLVLLTGPVRHSADQRLTKLAFNNIDRLKKEKDILITKAISWLLRHLIKYNRSSVKKYLSENIDQLPKIAIRETKNKLLTGKK